MDPPKPVLTQSLLYDQDLFFYQDFVEVFIKVTVKLVQVLDSPQGVGMCKHNLSEKRGVTNYKLKNKGFIDNIRDLKRT